jgi:vancomycin resistance protein VanJ
VTEKETASSESIAKRPQLPLFRRSDILVAAYAAILLLLLVVRHGLGDRTNWSFALNSLFQHAFWPTLLLLPVVIVRASKFAIVVLCTSIVIFLGHWGGLFVPRNRAEPSSGQTIRVMTYNTLGYNLDTAGTIRVVREMEPDIIALQELAPEQAMALENALGAKYPHRHMDARPGVTGSGILSRFPLRPLDASSLQTLPWIGTPMAVEIEIGGQRVQFVNFHTYAGPKYTRLREDQCRLLADFAMNHPGPLIFAGDLNATDQNAAHAIVTRNMRDSWREAGFGMGHTFPGKPTPDIGGSRPVILGIPVPQWLVRIDYIFHSNAMKTIDVQLGPGDAGSDHRPVMATLTL